MKVYFNQNILEKEKLFIDYTKKTYFSGDYVNAFCWYFQNRILFWEDVYLHLMASLRKMRIKIPVTFTPELFENQINILTKELKIISGRIKITVFRNNQNSDLIIELLPYKDFIVHTQNEIDVFREIVIHPCLISSLSVFHPINSIAKEYGKENDLQEVLLLNPEKRIARAIAGNIFLIQANTIYSNPVEEGALLSPLKKNLINFLRKKTDFIYKEEPLSPFQLQTANEIFILSDEKGVIPITKFKKYTFEDSLTTLLIKKFVGFSIELQ